MTAVAYTSPSERRTWPGTVGVDCAEFGRSFFTTAYDDSAYFRVLNDFYLQRSQWFPEWPGEPEILHREVTLPYWVRKDGAPMTDFDVNAREIFERYLEVHGPYGIPDWVHWITKHLTTMIETGVEWAWYAVIPFGYLKVTA